MQVRVITYNVQSPDLPSDPYPTQMHDRFQRVLEVVVTALTGPTALLNKAAFVCLQEVCADWAVRFAGALAVYGYMHIAYNYNADNWAPLYCMIFYPQQTFIATPLPVTLTGVVSSCQQITQLGLTQEDVLRNSHRRNGVVGSLFAVRANPALRFVVATYHAPCLFVRHPRAHMLHISNAVQFMSQVHRTVAGGVGGGGSSLPVVLAGDFNMTPDDAAYLQHVRGPDCIDAMAVLTRGRHVPTNCCVRFTGCLDYSLSNRWAEPTQQMLGGFVTSQFLCDAQPSDHALLQTVYTLKFSMD